MNQTWRINTRAHFRRFGQSPLVQLLPRYLLQQIAQQVELPSQYPKLAFERFIPFMVAALLWRERDPSTRRLAGLTTNPILQRVSKVDSVSHQAIADRLRSISLNGLRTVLKYVAEASRHWLGRRPEGRDLLKLFDCTTIEGSVLSYPWAAPNGDKNAIRLALGLDHQTDTPMIVENASETTSDNTVFPILVTQLNRGETGVFDAGFTKLSEFQRILEKDAYWVAHMADIYMIEVLHSYQLPSRGERYWNGWILLQDERVRVGTPRVGGPIEARRLHWYRARTAESRFVWTNHFHWKPKRIFQAEQARWRIEVHFRWLKRELGLDHLPSQTSHGVEAFFLLLALAWLVLRFLVGHQGQRRWVSFSCRDALRIFQNALIDGYGYSLLRQERPS